MRFRRAFLPTVILLLLTVFVSAQQSFWLDLIVKPYIQEKRSFFKEREIHPGVVHFTEFKPEGPYLINVVKVNLRQQELKLETAKGKGYLFGGERVSEMAERYSGIIVAAINGDFWRGEFIPIGPFSDSFRIYKSHHIEKPRAVFMVDDKMRPHIAVAKMKMVLEVDKATTCAIDVINANGEAEDLPAEEKDLFLFTAAFGKTTNTKPDGRTEVILYYNPKAGFIPNTITAARVIEVRKNAGNSDILNMGYMVLSGRGKAKEFLEKHLQNGMIVNIAVIVPEVERPIVLMIGGGPIILQKGEIKIDYKEEDFREAFVTDKHPRTAIGYSKDKNTLYLFTIDGRQPGLSIGADLYQVAEYMKRVGAYEAMNLDGGGSTTMWVRGELVNRPSDRTGERTVANALLLISESFLGEPQHIKIFPEEISLSTAGSVELNFYAEDKFHNPLKKNLTDFVVTCSPEIGRIENNKIFIGSKEAAEGKLTIGLKNQPEVRVNLPVKVEKLQRLIIEPATLVLRSGDTAEFKVKALGKEGKELRFRPSDLKINLPDFVARGGEGLELKAITAGKGKIEVALAGLGASIPIFVDNFREMILFDFEQLEAPSVEGGKILSGKFFAEEKTRLWLEKELKKQGAGAWRLDYAMLRGGTTAIYIPINARIETPPAELTLWVYGDEKNSWLRAELIDKDGEEFLIDFTSGTAGIYWQGWQFLRVPHSQIFPKWTNPGAMLDYPLVFKHLYIAQGREDAKASGSIVLDALSAIYPPEK